MFRPVQDPLAEIGAAMLAAHLVRPGHDRAGPDRDPVLPSQLRNEILFAAAPARSPWSVRLRWSLHGLPPVLASRSSSRPSPRTRSPSGSGVSFTLNNSYLAGFARYRNWEVFERELAGSVPVPDRSSRHAEPMIGHMKIDGRLTRSGRWAFRDS